MHGSHLYGLAGPHSDLDTFTVTTSTRGARQSVAGKDDSTTIGWDAFIAYAFSGSHQSVEALFSPYKEWHSHRELEPMLNNMRITGPDVLAKYRRTITAFSRSDSMKKRRHAARLWLNMQDLRTHGRFDPRMPPWDIAWANSVATNYYPDEFAELIHEGTLA